ncbi:hypothetical protein JXA80_05970, partial [bacterium]|nr:hypothetical protein [candidate division CSSED10-310 bacterium]
SIEGVGPLRANLAPIDPQKTYQWAPGKAQTAWLGNSLSERLCTVLERRLMDADRTGTSQLPLLSELEVHSLDIAAFMVGDVDDKLLEDLLFACNWIQFHKSGAIRIRQDVRNQWKKPLRHYVLPRAWALLSLVFTPFPLSFNNSVKTVRPDPVTLSLLRANRIGEACAVAQRRLFAAGYKPFRFRIPDHGDGMRLAAALLFPVRDRVRIASMLLDRDNDKEI